MMKAIMHFDKSQVAPLRKHISGTGTFNRDIAIMAGYTKFDVMCVGAAGGRSGNSSDGSTAAWGAGGGGGGSAIGRALLLTTLTPSVAYSVGTAGAHGANKGKNVRGGAGINGGNSTFGLFLGGGGLGGKGGLATNTPSMLGVEASDGGNGGSNTMPDGSHQASVGTGAGEDPDGDFYVGSHGTYENVGSGIEATGGGGGGRGRRKMSTIFDNAATNGYIGGNGNADVSSAGGTPVSYHGGDGGGANIKTIIGTDEFYGSYKSGSEPDGVVVIKLS